MQNAKSLIIKSPNRLNRFHNDFGLATEIIMESATVTSDKGSTTLHVRRY